MQPEDQPVSRGEPRPTPVVPAPEMEVVSRWSPARRAFDMIYVVFAIIDAFILIRILLKVLAANTAVPFTRFVYGVSDWLLSPFHGLLPTIVNGRSVFEMSALVGFLVYALLGYLAARLIAIMFMRDVTVSQSSRGRSLRPGGPE